MEPRFHKISITSPVLYQQSHAIVPITVLNQVWIVAKLSAKSKQKNCKGFLLREIIFAFKKLCFLQQQAYFKYTYSVF